MSCNRFVVVSRSCYAPKAGGGRFRHPVRLAVIDTALIQPHTALTRRVINSAAVLRTWSNVDSRYSGPRSAHGQALASAEQLAERLNRQLSEALLQVGAGI
jgi:hypothetical protein